MAISATKLHSEFNRRVNRADSNKNFKFDVPTIDSYLTEAQNIFYENRLSILETSPKVRDDLRKAEVKRYCKSCKTFKEDNRVCIVEIPKDFYRRTRQTAVVSCDDIRKCAEKEITLKVAQSDDLSEILKDTLVQPSFEYEIGYLDEANDGFYVYHNNAFKVKKVCIEYYKRLPDIAAPSLTEDGFYINSSGEKIEVDQGLILDTTNCWTTIVDIASLIAMRDVSDIQDYQSQLNKIMQVQGLHIS